MTNPCFNKLLSDTDKYNACSAILTYYKEAYPND
jgi:hypothetical protein